MPRLPVYFFSTKVKKFITASFIVVTISLIVSAIIANKFVIHNADINFGTPASPSNTIFTFVDFISLDADAGTLTLDWYPFTDCSSGTALAVDFYFDPNLLVSDSNSDSSQVPSDSLPTTPVFHYNSSLSCDITTLSSSDIFRTVTKLIGNDILSKPGGKSFNSLQNYPFDTYFAVISGFALDSTTNSSVTIATFDGLNSAGTLINFVVSKNPLSNSDASTGLTLIIDIKRSLSVKAFAILIVGANWIVTIAFLCITVASIIWPEDIVKEMFVIPIATLFAFSSVRANMPGAPSGFGCIMDYFGILPNLALMTISSAVLLLVVLAQRIRSLYRPSEDGGFPQGSSTDGEEKMPHTSSNV